MINCLVYKMSKSCGKMPRTQSGVIKLIIFQYPMTLHSLLEMTKEKTKTKPRSNPYSKYLSIVV